MINNKKIVVSFIVCFLIIMISFCFGCIDREDAIEYRVIFHATWSVETHPSDFPSNPHFSGLIGVSHNANVKFWSIGELASEGIKNMAETGSKSPLNIEFGNAILNNTALDLISGEGINPSPGNTNVTFQVTEEYPLVTLVTMIAPSPDWFVGVDSLNLYENDSFIDYKIFTLYPYDAGTDSGISYSSPNEATDPPEFIYGIEKYPFIYNDIIVPLGTFEFIKQE